MTEAFGDVRVILLEGDLGAGKTTLIQAICRHLGVEEPVTSPTFALINEYRTGADMPVYHMDMYRIETLDEALQIGVEEYLYSGHWCFVEWPGILRPAIEPPYVDIEIEVMPGAQRKFRILKYTGDG